MHRLTHLAVAASCLLIGFPLRNEAATAAAGRDFNPRVVIRRAFPAITNAPVVAASEATEAVVRDKELVLGVALNGKSRAYPINMLTGPRREIVNDDLGGRAIAATW